MAIKIYNKANSLQFFIGHPQPGLVEVVNLQNVHNEERGGREQAANELIFLIELLKAQRGQELVVDLERVLEVGRNFVELKHVDEQEHRHRVNDNSEMENVEASAPERVGQLERGDKVEEQKHVANSGKKMK